MKNTLTRLAIAAGFLLLVGPVTAQPLKKGIYRSASELIKNSPSLPFDYEVTTKEKGYGFMNSGGKHTYYRIAIDKSTARKTGMVFGFCDGEDVYICEENKLFTPKTGFSKVENLGRYGYYNEVKVEMMANPAGGGSTMTAALQHKVIDYKTAKVFFLVNKTMKTILADDPDLLYEFENEKRKGQLLKEYLVRYSKKHPL